MYPDELQQEKYRSGMAGSAGIVANETQPSKRAPQIQTQLEILGKEVGAQHDVIERLESQLGPVMSLSPPDMKSGTKEENEPTCPLAATIQRFGYAVSRNTQLLCAIARRLEV
jgi:hypothetical protein